MHLLILPPSHKTQLREFFLIIGIEDERNELTVQEHGCMVLAELACRQHASDQEIIECVATVTNVARLQMQEK